MTFPNLDYTALMRLALRLAKKGEGFVHPNPLVGAVLLQDGRVVAQGWHHGAGRDHAEVDCIKKARRIGVDLRDTTMVVTLEPCAHFGKTPPCVEALVRQGIPRVVVGMVDPNPRVAGRGLAYLRERGVEIMDHVEAGQCEAINLPFIKYITRRRPWVVIKAAMTLDGKIATRTGKSQWISGPESLRFAHKLRHLNQAIMVGARTVRLDDPQLTCRLEGRKKVSHPIRIVVDGRLSMPLDSKIANGELPSETIIATTSMSDPGKRKALEDKGCRLMVFDSKDGRIDFDDLAAELARNKIASLTVEGGAEILGQCLESKIVDKVFLIIAPKIFGGKNAPGIIGGLGVDEVRDAWRLRDMKLRRLGDDILVEGEVAY
jgi:diaminohydroxyphosphoribosylaminopyrimidine deaminase / 5-amino-6-(5-phosphoribosylamino)uracil reductase